MSRNKQPINSTLQTITGLLGGQIEGFGSIDYASNINQGN